MAEGFGFKLGVKLESQAAGLVQGSPIQWIASVKPCIQSAAAFTGPSSPISLG